MAGFVGVLEGGFLVVDAACVFAVSLLSLGTWDGGGLCGCCTVECAGDEEGAFCAAVRKDVRELLRVLIGSVVVGERNHPGRAAFCDDLTGCWACGLNCLDGVCEGNCAGGSCQ